MGKLLWGRSLSETTGCCQYVPVAIPGRYTETEMISAAMTKAVLKSHRLYLSLSQPAGESEWD